MSVVLINNNSNHLLNFKQEKKFVLDKLIEIRKKDKNAIRILYDNYGKRLYGYAVLKWKVDEDDAWELVYNTLYKIIQTIERYEFETEQKFTGFVFTVFTNNLRNHYQKNKEKKHATVELHDKNIKHSEEDNQVDKKDSIHMRCLQAGLTEIEDWKRMLLLMRAQDHSYEEIAVFVKRPVDQLKVYYMRLKKLITEKVNECVDKKLA